MFTESMYRHSVMYSPCGHTRLTKPRVALGGREVSDTQGEREGGNNVGCSGGKLTRKEGGMRPLGGEGRGDQSKKIGGGGHCGLL